MLFVPLIVIYALVPILILWDMRKFFFVLIFGVFVLYGALYYQYVHPIMVWASKKVGIPKLNNIINKWYNYVLDYQF